ncbi:uncharacterized protein NPIL_137001 [Nephila pilipes]|uniref:Spider venom protein n=1 Tax=Nephila pilipes TaxID=299642 RepID=A0A8X6NI44_NEPPI|nr:uncharacterized protein NPIL_137001 [Nephila pilipes]
MAYWILLLLYSVLVLLYAWNYQMPTIGKWPLLERDVPETTSPVVHCQDTKDCETHHICLNHACVPQLLRGEECYPETGEWTLVSVQGMSLAACICKYP